MPEDLMDDDDVQVNMLDTSHDNTPLPHMPPQVGMSEQPAARVTRSQVNNPGGSNMPGPPEPAVAGGSVSHGTKRSSSNVQGNFGYPAPKKGPTDGDMQRRKKGVGKGCSNEKSNANMKARRALEFEGRSHNNAAFSLRQSGTVCGSENSSTPLDVQLTRPPIHSPMRYSQYSAGLASSKVTKKNYSASAGGCGATSSAGNEPSNEEQREGNPQRNDNVDTFITLLWMAGYVAILAFLYHYIGI